MSTKVRLKECFNPLDNSTASVYYDCLDTLGDDENLDAPVYLELNYVDFTIEVSKLGGSSITLCLSRKIASDLGLVPSTGCLDKIL